MASILFDYFKKHGHKVVEASLRGGSVPRLGDEGPPAQ